MTAKKRPATSGYVPGAGLPLGVPVGSPQFGPSAQVSGAPPRSREPNTSAPSLPEVSHPDRARRIGHRQLADLLERLSERDRTVLRLLAEHRFLTTHQVQSFCFAEHQTDATAARVTRRVLARLGHDGLVRTLERRIGGYRAGSAATIWQLTPAGQRALPDDRRRKRSSPPSERFLRHCLAVADVHVLLAQHRRIEPIEDVTVEVEPASWRTYPGPGGAAHWLQPDLSAEVTTRDFVDRMFIEVDLGSESLPTLLRKCEQYEQYRRSGIEQARSGSFPLVVWFVLSDTRAAQLSQAVARSSRLTAAMYRYATPMTLPGVLAGGSP